MKGRGARVRIGVLNMEIASVQRRKKVKAQRKAKNALYAWRHFSSYAAPSDMAP
jgi:hypothetical protein